jgi:phosphocarrier protein HPr
MNIGEVNLSPAELKAVEDHKYFLSKTHNREVSIEEAIVDFIKTYSEDWKREKLRRDNLEQLNEIEKHKYFRSIEEGRDVGRSRAAEEWCAAYAGIWRSERESLERNGFKQIQVRIKDPNGLHMRPTSALASLATKYDCDVYVHKAGMPYYNFMLQGKPYMNVKSILLMLSLGIILGDSILFIATGSQAQEALDAIARELESHAPSSSANS